MSILGTFKLPALVNEPFTQYGPGSRDRAQLEQTVEDLKKRPAQKVYPNVDGKDVETGDVAQQSSPFDHKLCLAEYHQADAALVQKAIDGALAAKRKWVAMPLHDRAAIFYRAAALIQGPYRDEMMAATMLGQGKNPYQADIDCVAESIDFLKTFPALAEGLYQNQPPFNASGVWNRSEVRPLDGFVYAVSPFNFTALAVNLVLAPLIVGNVVVWKPSPGAILSSWLFNKIMIEAGLPAGVVQFVPGEAAPVTDAALSSRHFSALHFTGSTDVFRSLWSKIAAQVGSFTSYPRMVGETSGKNFHLLHPSTRDVRSAAYKTIRAAFEYQGQKCSACSRVYVPQSLAGEFLQAMVDKTKTLSMGDKMTDFCGPVINRQAFDRIKAILDEAKADASVSVLEGGQCDDSTGFYIVSGSSPRAPFISSYPVKGPSQVFRRLLTAKHSETDHSSSKRAAVQVHEGGNIWARGGRDSAYGLDFLQMVNDTSEFALTGAFFATDRNAIVEATEELRFAAGNFYINDQCTGAMPGHQPFGGSRASGTNDKAGTATLLQRFVSWRTIKEGFTTISDVLYPSNME
ncbi:1-pyrroline-5-carboxylate dehydrogenase [Microdochium trichocladiopsis]|uniref:L-glutamate gamma-semialdehyde dehydrogenase n=1 Tax=Microdochium trichocladiopsis TaxID=1682393 RepID=A0A9P8Y0U0_9PEZI|nr:1-pyrroline-5-carboxylate dehydrogenase [Microdochium trichocladiopsis]KAH7024771.1 1-pyrroline-5-carboxylate dehydrogenase [Microdochium trichocladiopsis]